MKPGSLRPPELDPLEANLHNLTNALTAARSYGEVLLLRVKSGTARDPALVETLLAELDRVGSILTDVRRRTYRAGDVVACGACGYTFVFRRKSGKAATCRRCNSADVAHWRPSD